MNSPFALHVKPVTAELPVPASAGVAPLHPADTEHLRWDRFPGFYRPDYDRCLTGVLSGFGPFAECNRRHIVRVRLSPGSSIDGFDGRMEICLESRSTRRA